MIPKWLTWLLWGMVLVCGIWFWWLAPRRSIAPDRSLPPGTLDRAGEGTDPPGVTLDDIPWKHLRDIRRFVLTDQEGKRFDSADLNGKAYLVSFFFSRCPGICRDLNKQIERLNEGLRKERVMFVSVTVDPEHDTPKVLHRYAEDFGADPNRWAFLTGQPYQVREVGEQIFRVEIDPAHHTEDIMLVDRWGRLRDRFKWSDPVDMKRLVDVVKKVSVEPEPPLNETVRTRMVLAGRPPIDLHQVPWLGEFFLTDQRGKTFYSRDMTGQVWIANFFFTSCPGICQQQIAWLKDFRKRYGDQAPVIVSITTDPVNDRVETLAAFAKRQGADDRWLFCTGDFLLTRRIASEFFGAAASEGHHSSMLFVVDRWGHVRGRFDWRKEEEANAMVALIERLKRESRPPRRAEKEGTGLGG